MLTQQAGARPSENALLHKPLPTATKHIHSPTNDCYTHFPGTQAPLTRCDWGPPSSKMSLIPMIAVWGRGETFCEDLASAQHRHLYLETAITPWPLSAAILWGGPRYVNLRGNVAPWTGSRYLRYPDCTFKKTAAILAIGCCAMLLALYLDMARRQIKSFLGPREGQRHKFLHTTTLLPTPVMQTGKNKQQNPFPALAQKEMIAALSLQLAAPHMEKRQHRKTSLV
jgi:hypothetical protein